MGTFQTWLHDQEGRDDQTGELARWWAGEAAVRPRVSTPSGIQKWLDKQLREGSLKDIEQAEKGRMRESFARIVHEYHDRDKPGQAGPRPDDPPPAWISEFREQLRMLRHGQNRIMAALGLDTPLATALVRAEQSGTVLDAAVVQLSGQGGAGLSAGHIEALKVRARLGEPEARHMLDARGIPWASDPAEPALDGADPAADELAAPGAGTDDAQDGYGDLSASELGALADLAAESQSPDAWFFLHRVADHEGASRIEGMPDDYAA